MIDFDLEFFLLLSTVLTGLVVLASRLFGSSGKKKAWLTELSISFFPVLLIVLLVRSFLFEPFRIPSGSMLPTLEIGDFIVVNKYAYGLRLPVLHTKFWVNQSPQRGDVAVFRYPKDPKLDYVKRIVGVPGDEISYKNKMLFINSEAVSYETLGTDALPGRSLVGKAQRVIRMKESLPEAPHEIYVNASLLQRKAKDVWVIPDGNYLVFGDNRDNSNDSRVWGMVPEENLVGRVSAIWMHWDFGGDGIDFSRIGRVVN